MLTTDQYMFYSSTRNLHTLRDKSELDTEEESEVNVKVEIKKLW